MKLEKTKLYLKVLWANPIILGIIVFSLFVSYGFFFFLIRLMDLYTALSFLSKNNYLLCIILIFMSYILLTSAMRTSQQELIDTMGRKFSFQRNLFVVLLLVIAVYHIIFILLFLGVALFRQDYAFLNVFMESYLYNMILPQGISLAIGFVLSLFASKMSILCMLAFIFMISPLSELMVWSEQPGFPIDQIYRIIKIPFEILYQNRKWDIDVMYGLQCEPQRLALMIIWMMIAFIIYYLKSGKSIRKISRKAIVILSIVLCLSLGAFAYLPASRLRINDAWDGYMYDLRTVQWDNLQEEKEIDYTFSEYDLNLSCSRMLNVDGKLVLESKKPRQDFTFTLYRTYHIDEIESEVSLSYQRDDDHVKLHFDEPQSQVTLSIAYHGYHPRFYSNYNAAMLPGYFAWYPMAGERQIFFSLSGEENSVFEFDGYNYYNHIEPAKITLHTDRSYVTNLSEGKSHVYEGVADSISLFDGNIESVNQGQIASYLPLDNIDNLFEVTQANYKKDVEFASQYLDIDKEEFMKKKLFIVSDDMIRNTNNGNGIAIFDDYILLSESPYSSDEMYNSPILNYYILSSTREVTVLWDCFRNGGSFSNDPEEIYQNMIMYLQSDERKGAEELTKLSEEAYQKVGADGLLKAMVQYAFSEESNDEEFLRGVIEDAENQ